MVRDEVMFELWTLQLPLLRSPSLDDTPFSPLGSCVLIKLADLLMAVLISLRLSAGRRLALLEGLLQRGSWWENGGYVSDRRGLIGRGGRG